MSWYHANMNATLTVDKAGRVVLPKPVRDELQLSAGDSLELEISEEQIVLRPLRSRVGMRKKQGIWVLDFDEPISAAATNRVLRDIRSQRQRSALGQPKFKHESAKPRSDKSGKLR
jgi:AbrB family looped-hinge helix DNA binding protein